MKSSIWIAVGDIHNDVGRFHSIPELDAAEGIIITGDITFAEGSVQAAQTLRPFIETGKRLLVQPGNMDEPEVADWLTSQGWNLHCAVRMLPFGIPCLGVGFSPTTPFNTPGEFPDEQFAIWLNEIMAAHPELSPERPGLTDSPAWVFVSHTPPYNTRCDRLANGIPVGSPAIRAFIERYQPTYCLCGHIHEAVGTDTLGKTTIINPGALAGGGYIILELSGNSAQPVFAEYRHC